MIVNIPAGSLNVGQQAARKILGTGGEMSWVVVLPGLWGAESVIAHLCETTEALRIDGTLTDGRPGGPIRAALRAVARQNGTSEDEPTGVPVPDSGVPEALAQWAHNHDGSASDQRGMVVVEAPELLDELSETVLEELLADGRICLVLVAPSEEVVPQFLASYLRSGRVQIMTPSFMSVRDMDVTLRRRFTGAISATVLHRMAALCGGHQAIAERVLQAAMESGVLSCDGGLWRWKADESGFRDELARIGGEVLSGFTNTERDLLVLTAVAGRLPRRWVVERYGAEAVQSLQSQRVIGVESQGRHGFLDLRITAECVRMMVIEGTSHLEKMRLWYEHGRSISPESAGPSARAALTRWKALAEEAIDAESAERAAEIAIARRWYRLILDVMQHAVQPSATLRVLAARAHYALGHVSSALQLLDSLEPESGGGLTSESGSPLHRAVLLAERISLFHPEAAGMLIAKLRSMSDSPLTTHLDHVKAWAEDWTEFADAGPLGNSADGEVPDREEAAVAQLWLGAKLGLSRNPDLGRLILSMLLDDLARDAQSPDVEESATALLLLITMIHGWRTDVLRLNLQVWSGGATHAPALPAVADIVAAISAMQQDRMPMAYEHASAAVQILEVVDPFGLHPFAASVCAATSAYLSEDLRIDAHDSFWEHYGTEQVAQGPLSLRLVSQGLALVGSGPPTLEVADHLIRLASEAREQQEWAQEQQLLLLALLGQSETAAEAVLETRWHRELGRSRMIGMLAQATLSPIPEETVEIAELLIKEEIAFFGLTLLAGVWSRRDELDRETRVRVIQAVQIVRRRLGETSWTIRTFFSDLSLDERETQVLRGLQSGQSGKEIAGRLHLSPRTIDATIAGMFRRFSCTNRVELVTLGLLQD